MMSVVNPIVHNEVLSAIVHNKMMSVHIKQEVVQYSLEKSDQNIGESINHNSDSINSCHHSSEYRIPIVSIRPLPNGERIN